MTRIVLLWDRVTLRRSRRMDRRRSLLRKVRREQLIRECQTAIQEWERQLDECRDPMARIRIINDLFCLRSQIWMAGGVG